MGRGGGGIILNFEFQPVRLTDFEYLETEFYI